jgi:hypothetical protein
MVIFSPSCDFVVCLKNLRNTFTKMLGRNEKPEFEDVKGGKVEEDSMVSSKRLDVAGKLSDLGH